MHYSHENVYIEIEKLGRWRYRGRVMASLAWHYRDGHVDRTGEECVYPMLSGRIRGTNVEIARRPGWEYGRSADRLRDRLRKEWDELFVTPERHITRMPLRGMDEAAEKGPRRRIADALTRVRWRRLVEAAGGAAVIMLAMAFGALVYDEAGPGWFLIALIIVTLGAIAIAPRRR